MSKYIDLAEKLARMHDLRPGTIRVALGLLDKFAAEHPDQVPGRTITRTEFNKAFTEWFDERDKARIVGIIERLFGITVIPDPEPTNAELINEAYAVWDRDPQDFTFGEYLDRLGYVKAPGGDDE